MKGLPGGAWYERLTMFILDKGYKRVKIDKILFIRHLKIDLIIALIYVDGTVFGSTSEAKSREFVNLMQRGFKMSMASELIFFLGL